MVRETHAHNSWGSAIGAGIEEVCRSDVIAAVVLLLMVGRVFLKEYGGNY